MLDLFSKKGKKGRFSLSFTLHGLSGVPYVSGFYFAKWKLGSWKGTSGRTSSSTVKNHTVVWNYNIIREITLSTNKSGEFCSYPLFIDFRQSVSGSKSERIGVLSLELFEFLNGDQVPKRYLLSSSKVNSMAIITIEVNPLEGSLSANEMISSSSDPSVRPTSAALSPSARLYTIMSSNLDLGFERNSLSLTAHDPDAEFMKNLFVQPEPH